MLLVILRAGLLANGTHVLVDGGVSFRPFPDRRDVGLGANVRLLRANTHLLPVRRRKNKKGRESTGENNSYFFREVKAR